MHDATKGGSRSNDGHYKCSPSPKVLGEDRIAGHIHYPLRKARTNSLSEEYLYLVRKRMQLLDMNKPDSNYLAEQATA